MKITLIPDTVPENYVVNKDYQVRKDNPVGELTTIHVYSTAVKPSIALQTRTAVRSIGVSKDNRPVPKNVPKVTVENGNDYFKRIAAFSRAHTNLSVKEKAKILGISPQYYINTLSLQYIPEGLLKKAKLERDSDKDFTVRHCRLLIPFFNPKNDYYGRGEYGRIMASIVYRLHKIVGINEIGTLKLMHYWYLLVRQGRSVTEIINDTLRKLQLVRQAFTAPDPQLES
jgi:hypothetical protein